MEQELHEELKQQAESFGLENRTTQTIEECSELIHALCKYKRKQNKDKTCVKSVPTVIYNITEEIADVEICLEQLKHLLCCNNDVESIKKQKVQRTRNRLVRE